MSIRLGPRPPARTGSRICRAENLFARSASPSAAAHEWAFYLRPVHPRPEQDGLLKNEPPVWDANRDGVYTCDEWKGFADRMFSSADRKHDGKLDPSEFATVQRADATLADTDFGYFDENQDGKITRKGGRPR